MNKLRINELCQINGGVSTTVWALVGMGIIFIASIVYGFVNPNKCNN